MLEKLLQLLQDERIILFLIWVGLCFFMLVIDVTTETIRKISQAKRIIKERTPILLKLRKKHDIISNEASCYSNSLGMEGAKFIAEIRHIIDENIKMIKSLDIAVQDIDVEGIKLIINEEYYGKKENFTAAMKRADKLILHLSEKIISASSTATSLGLPKIRKKNLTSDSLDSILRNL